jgi:hypothetical protein
MIDPFRGELTRAYVERENLEWATRERLARSVRPRHESRSLLSRVAEMVSRELSVTPQPGLGDLRQGRRPAL